MNVLIQSLLIGFVALFGYANAIMGSSMLDRPLVISPLVGLVLGDLQMGIMVGATLELVWLGAFPVGASNPPDMVSGTIIGASFVISSGSEAGTAVALAVPIATLVLMLSNILMMFVIPQLCCVMADRNAAKGNVKGVEHAHLLAVSIFLIPLSLLVAVSYYVGAPFIADIVKSIPAFITHGLEVATGIIPAIGFAMLARMIMTKDVAAFFFGGFLLSAYLQVPVLGVALMACVIVIVIMTIKKDTSMKMEVVQDDNEF